MLKLIRTIVLLLLLASTNFAQPSLFLLMDDNAQWTPLSVSGLEVWCQADVGYDVIGGYWTWADQSGNGRDMTTKYFYENPTVVANQLNGYSVVPLIKASTQSIGNVFTLAQPFTIYCVMKQTTWTSGDVLWSAATEGSGLLLLQQFSATPRIDLFAGGRLANTDLAENTWGIVRAIYNGASSSLRVNDNAEATGNPGTVGLDGFVLGSNGHNGGYSDMVVAELLIYSGVVSTGDDAAIMDYLNTKYIIY